jgi:hypothetical protein
MKNEPPIEGCERPEEGACEHCQQVKVLSLRGGGVADNEAIQTKGYLVLDCFPPRFARG